MPAGLKKPQKPPRPDTEEEAAFRAEIERRIEAMQDANDWRLLHLFDVEQAADKAFHRMSKLYGRPSRTEAPEIDWVATFRGEFEMALADEAVLRVVRQMLDERKDAAKNVSV